MFSENDRISSRQIKYIVWMEALAKLCLMLPVYLEGKRLGSVIVCVAAGLMVSLWFSTLVVRWSGGRDFFTCVREATCRPLGVLVYAAGFLYFLASGAVFLNLGAEAARAYLLPEVPVPILVILLFAAGVYLCCQGIEVRGRFCEVAGPVVGWLAVLLVFASAFGMDAYQYEETRMLLSDHLAFGAYDVFACLGSVFLPLLTGAGATSEYGAAGSRRGQAAGTEAGQISGEEEKKAEGQGEGGRVPRAVRRGICGAVVTAGCLTAVTVASYGKNTMASLTFPAVRVMSNVTIPGGFFRRWEVLFLVLLLFSLTASVAGAFWYMRVICARLFGEREKWRENREEYWFAAESEGEERRGVGAEKNRLRACDFPWLFSLMIAWFAAAGFLDGTCALCYYRGLNLYFLLPLVVFLYFIMFFRKKGRGLPLTLLGAAVCLLLSGCTARELEERLFPMALEIRMENDALCVTYAWNEGSGPGSKQEPGENGEEKESETEAEEETKAEWKGEEARAPAVSVGENLTVFRASSLSGVWDQLLEYTGQYVDYSHVKAVIVDESLAGYPLLEAELLEWMEAEPEFATSLLLYPAQKSGLLLEEISEKAQGRVGPYLENLYKNNEKYRETAVTLGEVLAYYHRK